MIGVAGYGYVGGAIADYFSSVKEDIRVYDKYKMSYINPRVLLDTDITFLCLPTLYNKSEGFSLHALHEVCSFLSIENYRGVVVIKSTVLPGTCRMLRDTYGLRIVHNPEFLTARTAKEDFETQKHIVIGHPNQDDGSYGDVKELMSLYTKHFTLKRSNTKYSTPSYEESELMKLSCNAFYAIKVQFFNELYALCEATPHAEYDKVRSAMLQNNWINPMHTLVPGHDGLLSYGGACFPKDTKALLRYMEGCNSPHEVLEACVSEQIKMRGSDEQWNKNK